ncbi:MAG TPA: uracil-DNA glycosylase [Steroidobacteraceae bacterium]|nr:uracil-DNA glycosylase [Steroidobacteraceae bacterium]
MTGTGPPVVLPRKSRRGAPFDPDCRLCPRLASYLDEVRLRHPDYHCRPVAPFGPTQPRLLLVGLAPGLPGANRTGRPFTGDFAGILLYRTLFDAGFATRPVSVSRDDGLRLVDCRISNAVKCLPPGNKPLPDEVRRCNRYLLRDIDALRAGSVILALGAIAHGAVLQALELRRAGYRFAHGAEHALPGPLTLLDSYHCSRLNTNTGRLTPAMFARVVARARHLIRG